MQAMQPIDWKSEPFEKVVEEYERRRDSPSVKDLFESFGVTKQAFFARLSRFYAKRDESKNQGAA